MGIGKASVYKYIPEYFPKDVGAVGGLVGTLGALGGFFLPLGFGYLEKSTGRRESCFWMMLALVAVCLVWLHAIVIGMRPPASVRVRPGRWKTRTSALAPARAPGCTRRRPRAPAPRLTGRAAPPQRAPALAAITIAGRPSRFHCPPALPTIAETTSFMFTADSFVPR